MQQNQPGLEEKEVQKRLHGAEQREGKFS